MTTNGPSVQGKSPPANGTCGTCKVNMLLGYDTQIVNPSTGNGELVTLQYNFKDQYANTGSCQFVVHPDLTITGP